MAVTVIKPPVPESLLTCPAQPDPGAIENDAALGDFIIDLAAAGQSCRDTLAAVAKIVR